MAQRDQPQKQQQPEKQLASLSPIERVRYMHGYIEQFNLLSNPGIDAYLEKLKTFAKQHNDDFLLKEVAYYERNRALFNMQDDRSKLDMLIKLNKEFRAEKDLLHTGVNQIAIAQLQFQLEDYAQAFENLMEAKQIFKKIGYENVPSIGKCLHDFALDHFFFQNYREAIGYMKESIKLPKYNRNLDIQRYNTLGMSYLKLSQLDSAYLYLSIAHKKAVEYDDRFWVGLIAGNIGEIYDQKGEYQKAFDYFLQDYTINVNSDFPDVQQNAIINLAKGYLRLGDLDKAHAYLRLVRQYFPRPKAFTFGNRQLLELAKLKYYEVSRLYYQKTGDYKAAMLYADSLHEAEKIRDQKYNALQIKLASGKVEIQKNKLAVVQTEKEKALIKWRYSVILFIISILAFTGFWLFYRTRQRKKKEKAMFILNQQAATQELKKAQDEIDLFIRKINEQSMLTERFREELRKLKTIESEERKHLESTIMELRSTRILTDDNWIDFQRHFAKIFPGFLPRLKAGYPAITEAEIRYLMLSKLQLSHKEMAQALGISADAVRVTWNRVRKKLDGTLDDTPQSLIEQFG